MGRYRISSFVITWINLITLIASLAILSFGIFLAAKHGDCEKFFTAPVLVIGAFSLILSLVGCVGAWRDNVCLLWTYLTVLFLLIAGVAVFTVFAFVVTSKGAGHAISGQAFKEYRLGDYSHWIQKQTNDPARWKHLKSCFVQTSLCNELPKKYHTIRSMRNGKLSSIESGCCRPPSECGFAMKNSTFYDLTSRIRSSNKDCRTYKNDRETKCYNCDSCKAGVAEYLKKKWRRMSTFNVVLFVILIVVYSVGCCARRSASRSQYYKIY
ncbi:tetraspanin-10 isoform X1 [Selaginella moellendorffii]|uniref:tetraspanin-10 isoform X1 n=1 Tax=Selaginella moellendorffii TaxID=88036 RepID=UPI000D1CBB6C|nr:tetraspanin-10 isoform X1 [Selaginella moellendorffii]|eukprot:XP_024519460.1 tetraspanin-10 isoform X1 [Selaginella moellendorffii]